MTWYSTDSTEKKAFTVDLFTPIAEHGRLHPNFLNTIEAHAADVRAVLNQWADGFEDRDGKFVHEFQTTYNSCFWELYLYAVLKHLNIGVDFTKSSPDFVSSTLPVAIEAAIASHAQDDIPEWEKTIDGIVHDNLTAAYIQSITRLSNAFMGKVRAYDTKYIQLPHMAQRAYVIAIANYGTQDFNMLGDVAMQRLLYDVWEERQVLKPNGAEVPVGLFRSESFSQVSAVIYSSLATFGKARALGSGNPNLIFQAIRIKDNYNPIRIVSSKADYQESLTDGLRLFANPFAETPVKMEWFDDWGIRQFDADQNGDFTVSCHEDGDLCMRMVIHQMPAKEAPK